MKRIRGIKSLLTLAAAMSAADNSTLTLYKAIGLLLSENEFVHRGHGGKFGTGGSRHKVLCKMRRQSGRSYPSNGARECARRVRQMQRNELKQQCSLVAA